MELELNRRFSQDIYLELVTITQGDKGLTFNGPGQPLAYAVKMRRIPNACLMDQRLLQNTFEAQDKDRLVNHLVSCYRQAPRPSLDSSAFWQRLHGLIEENRSSLYELALHLQQDPAPWLALCSQQSLFMQVYRELMEERVEKGHIIEGHGDLRPEHIVLDEQVAMIDGIEFNRDFRILDLADELSFLAMECAVTGHAELGAELRQRVLDQLHDQAPPELLAFYESYRALVRAKVNLLKAEQLPTTRRETTLQQVAAYRSLAEPRLKLLMPPFTFLLTGAMGSGKTTLARALKQDLGAIHLESDQVRRQMFGKSSSASNFGEGHYTADARLKVYENMRDSMLEHLHLGMNVIVDASFSDPQYVESILDALRREGRPYLIVVCECSDALAIARIQRRLEASTSPSEARPELYREQKKKGDWTFQGQTACRVNTECGMQEQMQKVYQQAAAVLRKNGKE
jgi:aminoglycoside phosphotransferase family enzyme/predicted kinase